MLFIGKVSLEILKMAGCSQCTQFKNDYGPFDSLYCQAYQAKMNESSEFRIYFGMGGSATKACPYGKPQKDYED